MREINQGHPGRATEGRRELHVSWGVHAEVGRRGPGSQAEIPVWSRRAYRVMAEVPAHFCTS